jgi:hypothetical protein
MHVPAAHPFPASANPLHQGNKAARDKQDAVPSGAPLRPSSARGYPVLRPGLRLRAWRPPRRQQRASRAARPATRPPARRRPQQLLYLLNLAIAGY